MIGGLPKYVSGLALVAVASVAFGGVSAKAADLGGNCCADLEERVAELEATTARKGNRKVRLTVSGHVNEAILFWDDGSEKNAYVVSNNASRTRFRFVGDAKINADWTAGYLLEIGARYANTGSRTQLSTGAGGNSNSIDIRHSAWYLDSKTFGRVWVGKTSSATDGITEINLSNATYGPDFAFGGTGGGFFLRRSGTNGQGGLSLASGTGVTSRVGLTVGLLTNQISGNSNVGEGDRNNVIKYVSPTFYGFTVQYAWGEDDLQDVALRYAGEFGAFRVAGGIGYRRSTDINTTADGTGNCANRAATAIDGAGGFVTVNNNQSAVKCDQLGLSASVMHTPTGLYLAGSYGTAKDDNRKALFGYNAGGAALDTSQIRDKEDFWYIQGGIEQNWLGIGKTTLYGEYYKGNFPSATSAGTVALLSATDPLNSLAAGAGQRTVIGKYELSAWGLGVTQSIDAAAMDIYLNYRRYEHDLTLVRQNAAGGSTTAKSNPIADSQFFTIGGIIRF